MTSRFAEHTININHMYGLLRKFVGIDDFLIFCAKIERICNFVALLHHPFWISLFRQILGITFQLFEITMFG